MGDLGLESPRVRTFAEWLSQTPPSMAIQSAFWFIRLLQATHLLAAGLVVSSGVLTGLRVLGWYRGDLPFDTVWNRFAPWLMWGRHGGDRRGAGPGRTGS